MNHITLIGRLTKDPELKYSQSGKAYCRFTLAVAREFNRDETDFLDCVAWNKAAEIIAEYLRKGKRAAIQGRLETGTYEKDGKNIKTHNIVVDRFEFVDSARSETNKNQSYSNNNDDVLDDNDDFPF
jgi:single-strand binding protein